MDDVVGSSYSEGQSRCRDDAGGEMRNGARDVRCGHGGDMEAKEGGGKVL